MLALSQAVRELARRRVRSALTAAGIAIGVTALLLLGALAERMTQLVKGGRDFATGQISVSGAGGNAISGMTRGGLVSGDDLARLRTVAGVAAVAPIVMFPLSNRPTTVPFTLSPMVFGIDLHLLLLNTKAPPPQVAAGQLTPSAANHEVVLGHHVARLYELGVGDQIEVRGQPFRVVGVLAPTLTGPDSFVFMPFEAATRLLIDSEPWLKKLVLTPGATVLPIATAAAVFWASAESPEAVAARIRDTIPTLSVVTPDEASTQLDRATEVLNGVLAGSALVALLIASLAVVNTMLMAVSERRREIGLRRVAGATRRQVLGQLILEAMLLGAAGSLAGTLVGFIGVGALNAITERVGAPAFLLTPRLVLVGLLLPPLLATAAGLWPARRAAHVPPTDAARFV